MDFKAKAVEKFCATHGLHRTSSGPLSRAAVTLFSENHSFVHSVPVSERPSRPEQDAGSTGVGEAQVRPSWSRPGQGPCGGPCCSLSQTWSNRRAFRPDVLPAAQHSGPATACRPAFAPWDACPESHGPNSVPPFPPRLQEPQAFQRVQSCAQPLGQGGSGSHCPVSGETGEPGGQCTGFQQDWALPQGT